MPDQPQPIQVQIEAEWLDPTDTPVHFANFFGVQVVKDEFVLTFGTGVPPIITNPLTPEQARQLKFQIRPTARIGMTPGRLLELMLLIQSQLKAYNETLQEPN